MLQREARVRLSRSEGDDSLQVGPLKYTERCEEKGARMVESWDACAPAARGIAASEEGRTVGARKVHIQYISLPQAKNFRYIDQEDVLSSRP